MAFTGFEDKDDAMDVGDLLLLPTADKTSLVASIIELDANIKAIPIPVYGTVTLTGTHIADKSIILDFIPLPKSVELSFFGGAPQAEDIDFVVIELLAEVGDLVRINYFRG